jgi:hypothetical protein
MTVSSTQARCVFQLHESPVEIYEYQIHDNSYAAVNELSALYDQTLQLGTYYPGKITRMLYTITAPGVMPIYYMYKCGKAWREAHPDHQPAHIYAAIVYAHQFTAFESIINTLLRFVQMPRFTLRQFPEDRTAAIAWLAQQK